MSQQSPSMTDESLSMAEDSSTTEETAPMSGRSSSTSEKYPSVPSEERSSVFEEWIRMAQEEESPPLAEQWTSMVEEWIKMAQEDVDESPPSAECEDLALEQEMYERAEDLPYMSMIEESAASMYDWLCLEEIYARELAQERSLNGEKWFSTSIDTQKEAVDQLHTYYPLSIGTLSQLKPEDHWHDHRIRALGHVRDEQPFVLRSIDEVPVQTIRLDITYATSPVVFHKNEYYQVYGRVRQCQKSDSVCLVVDFARVMSPNCLETYKEELFCIEQVGTSCEGCTKQRISLAETKDCSSPRTPPEYTNVWGEI